MQQVPSSLMVINQVLNRCQIQSWEVFHASCPKTSIAMGPDSMSTLKHLKNTAEDPVLGFLAIHGWTGDTPLSFSKRIFFRYTLWQGWDFSQVSGSKLGALEQLPLRCSRWNTPNYCSNTHAKFWSWLTILRAQNPTVGFHSPSALDKPLTHGLQQQRHPAQMHKQPEARLSIPAFSCLAVGDAHATKHLLRVAKAN